MAGCKKKKVYEYITAGKLSGYKLNKIFESKNAYCMDKWGKQRPILSPASYRRNKLSNTFLLNNTTQLLKDKTIISLKKINRNYIYKLLTYFYSPYVDNGEVEWKKGEGKRIYCYDLRGKRVAISRNMRDASNLLGVNSSTIASRIRTGEVGSIDNQQLYGLRFEYKNNN